MSEQQEPNEDAPIIAGVYVETDRYRHLTGLERQVRALLDALHRAQHPEQVAEALRLALAENDDAMEASLSLDPSRWALYQALSELVEASGWKPPR